MTERWPWLDDPSISDAFKWEPAKYEALPVRVQKARLLLADWFEAMECGMAGGRMPDPTFQPEIGQELADRVMEHLDANFQHELGAWAGQEHAGGYNATPGFTRLIGTPQAVALAQALRCVLKGDTGDPPLAELEYPVSPVYIQPGARPACTDMGVTW